MKKLYYVKEGRKYVPVAEYDSNLCDSFHKGTHLVMVYPGGTTRRFNIDPNYAALIAAGRVAEDAFSKAIMEAGEIRRNYKLPKELTPGQRAAWEKLVEEFGEDARQLEWPSAREACEEAVKAMQAEADKLMQHPSAKKAFERFVTVCALTQDHTVGN